MCVHEVTQSLEGEIFALRGDQHAGRRCERVQGEQAQRRRAVDDDALDSGLRRGQRSAQQHFAVAQCGELDLGTGEATLERAALATGEPGLQLVPSHIDLAGAEIELATLSARETRLRTALTAAPPRVECVIIDCPPSLGLLTLNALAAASAMLIPTQCEYFALEGLRHLMYTHQLVRSHLNPRLAISGILMTQFDARTTLSWDVIQSVRRSYPHHVLETLIPRNVRISEAPSHGKSVIEYDPTCRGAAAYRALAKELLER